MSIHAMILAAGKGTRLKSLTEAIPKPMLPINGKPVIEHILAWLRFHGIRRVAINTHYQAHVIERHLGDGSAMGMHFAFSYEPELLGTAGGVKRMEHFLGDPFVVIYGDVLSDVDLHEVILHHKRSCSKPHATLVLDERPDALQCGVADVDSQGLIRRFIEKPKPDEVLSRWVNSGLMVLDQSLMRYVPNDRPSDFGREIIPAWLDDNIPIYAWMCPPDRLVIDMGTPEKYEQACRDWPTRALRFTGGTK